MVRSGCELSSEKQPLRLGCGAVVEELALEGDRLHYRRHTGVGPDRGWVGSCWGGVGSAR